MKINKALAFVVLLTLSSLSSVGIAHDMNIAQFTFIEQEQSSHYRLLVNNLPQSLVPNQQVKHLQK